MGKLSGKTVFVTGAGAGIGRATAVLFASEGAKVALVDIDRDRGLEAEDLAKSKAAFGGEARFIEADITDSMSTAKAVARCVEVFGCLTTLHNNAGGSSMADGRVTDASEEEFWRVMSLNAYGTFLGAKHGIPEIIRAGGGSVINMSSNMALMGMPGRDCYTASKGAVSAMTRSMAVEYAADKVRVNAIAPSVVRTERINRFLVEDANIAAQSKMHLLGFVDPQDVAKLALYLASDDSRLMTGQIVSLDSGITIS